MFCNKLKDFVSIDRNRKEEEFKIYLHSQDNKKLATQIEKNQENLAG